jgi:hypothetical protein
MAEGFWVSTGRFVEMAEGFFECRVQNAECRFSKLRKWPKVSWILNRGRRRIRGIEQKGAKDAKGGEARRLS